MFFFLTENKKKNKQNNNNNNKHRMKAGDYRRAGGWGRDCRRGGETGRRTEIREGDYFCVVCLYYFKQPRQTFCPSLVF